MNPVFILPNVGQNLHTEATDSAVFYFGLRFEEKTKAHFLLLRTTSFVEREGWVKFLTQFIHAGSVSLGVPVAHPIDPSVPRVHDPEELDARDRLILRRTIMEWDEGQDWRQACSCPQPLVSNWDSDGEGGSSGHTSPRKVAATAAQTQLAETQSNPGTPREESL